MDLTPLYTIDGDDILLRVHVAPGAGKSAPMGRHGDALKIRVAAPPVGGRANDAARELLADTFGVKEKTVELESGETSRSKRFRLVGIDQEEFEKRLHILVEPEERPRPT